MVVFVILSGNIICIKKDCLWYFLMGVVVVVGVWICLIFVVFVSVFLVCLLLDICVLKWIFNKMIIKFIGYILRYCISLGFGSILIMFVLIIVDFYYFGYLFKR